MSIFKTFTGFRGRASVIQIDGINFMIVARNDLNLRTFHEVILKQVSAPFNPDAVNPVIVISSSILPEPKQHHEQNSTRQNPEA